MCTGGGMEGTPFQQMKIVSYPLLKTVNWLSNFYPLFQTRISDFTPSSKMQSLHTYEVDACRLHSTLLDDEIDDERLFLCNVPIWGMRPTERALNFALFDTDLLLKEASWKGEVFSSRCPTLWLGRAEFLHIHCTVLLIRYNES